MPAKWPHNETEDGQVLSENVRCARVLCHQRDQTSGCPPRTHTPTDGGWPRPVQTDRELTATPLQGSSSLRHRARQMAANFLCPRKQERHSNAHHPTMQCVFPILLYSKAGQLIRWHRPSSDGGINFANRHPHPLTKWNCMTLSGFGWHCSTVIFYEGTSRRGTSSKDVTPDTAACTVIREWSVQWQEADSKEDVASLRSAALHGNVFWKCGRVPHPHCH